MDFSLDRLTELYVSEIVRLHGVLISIIPDRDLRFTSRFWSKLQDTLGTQLHFSTAFHPQTDGNWEKYLPLVEFAYNNSYQSSVKMAPYEAMYGRKCRTPLYYIEISEKKLHGVDLVRETEEKSEATSDSQKSCADLKRKEIEFQVGDKVFLKVSPWKKVLRFGHKGKLSSRFIGPYEIIERIGPLALPLELDRIHNAFHVYMLRRYRSDPSHVISPTELRSKEVALVKVLWQKHGIKEATWELEDTMRKQYPNIFTGKIFEDKNS
ncbi:DNA/RNA polymerases superfamily protein [Gossypium australe]|uniref:DNA/RNA polymerases superfamily protein n=1 Tax=Gossypium australe TaxID=47621 RepID=A0A5B6VVL2_9ROSI|nr:DNA/RNA polymerases superfamily protein [Gossypium australe]